MYIGNVVRQSFGHFSEKEGQIPPALIRKAKLFISAADIRAYTAFTIML